MSGNTGERDALDALFEHVEHSDALIDALATLREASEEAPEDRRRGEVLFYLLYTEVREAFAAYVRYTDASGEIAADAGGHDG